ncbi:MAG: alpha/beta hydrolase [Candidatus Falkowbacteria bacterium]|nr:alpha/beta hydrolase [Candidatus Falkowbacteria bacterium]
MKKVFLIHGFEGTPNGGWRPWLMSELDKKNIYCCALPMPSPKDPICSEWIEEIASNVKNNFEDTILVGHSLGSPAILRYLESQADNACLAGVILVSGPCEKILADKPDSKLRKIDGFLESSFDFKKLKLKAKKFIVIHGDNDNKVPLDQGQFVSRELDCELIAIKNGGHLSGDDGYTALPEALEKILEMI